MTIDKSNLREQMRARLGVLPDNEVREHSARVWERLAVLSQFATAPRIGAYVSAGPEIDTHGLIRQLLAMGRQVGVPAFDGKQYRLAAVQDFDADLVAGKFGILEPKTSGTAILPDAWLVPGLAFDANGNRLGRGRGYFDALLRGARGVKFALAHDFQVLDEVPVEPQDVGVNFIVTESRVVNCKG
jgi:5-formyltetrahydrofolate cyclo-ligase